MKRSVKNHEEKNGGEYRRQFQFWLVLPAGLCGYWHHYGNALFLQLLLAIVAGVLSVLF